MKVINNADKNMFFEAAKGKKIIIFGTGLMFKDAINDLFENNYDMIDTVIDNNPALKGKCISSVNSSLKICSADILKKIDSSEHVMLITTKYYRDIIRQCNEMNVSDMLICFIYNDIYWNFSITERALKQFKMSYSNQDLNKNEVNELLIKKKRELSEKKDYLIFPKLNFIVTEKCTLSCKDCRALVPGIGSPRHIPLEEIIDDVTSVLDAVDEIVDIEPIGGEPFLYPYLAEVLDCMISSPKTNFVSVSTNGTIVPNEKLLKTLQNNKVFVTISDYGHIEKMAKLIACFEKNKINFAVETDQVWFDVGDIQMRGRSKEELIDEYRNCYCQYLTKYICNHKIWVCPRAPRLSLFNIVSENDYFPLVKGETQKNRENIQKSYDAVYADACNFCSQGDLNIKYIPAGIQTDNRFFHSEYTIIKRNEYENMKRRLMNFGE